MKIFNNNKPAIVSFALLAGFTLINGSVLADELCGTGEIHCFNK